MRIDSEAVSQYYKEMQIHTMPQSNRIAFLHETMQNLVRQAILGEKKDIRERLDTVQNILAQLLTKLKTEDEEDEVSNGLLLLYDYIYEKLENEDAISLKESLDVLTILHETFDKLMKKRK